MTLPDLRPSLSKRDDQQHSGGIGPILLGFLLIWLVLDRSAAFLKSGRGEAGVIVCALVVVTALLVEGLLFRRTVRQALQELGFGRPGAGGMVAALLISAVLLAFYPIFSQITGAQLGLIPHWPWLAVGLFAQGGIAEEMLFRGFVFRRFRQGRPFWRAAFLSMLVFTAIHLLLFFTLSPPIAFTSTLLAVVISFPQAYLFERGRSTFWAPALVHFAIHSIKLVQLPEPRYMPAVLAWLGLCMVAPYLAFALPPRFLGDASAVSASGR